jgi:hypothetical protein
MFSPLNTPVLICLYSDCRIVPFVARIADSELNRYSTLSTSSGSEGAFGLEFSVLRNQWHLALFLHTRPH